MITQVTTCYCSWRACWGFLSISLSVSPLSQCASPPLPHASLPLPCLSLWPNFPSALKVTHTHTHNLLISKWAWETETMQASRKKKEKIKQIRAFGVVITPPLIGFRAKKEGGRNLPLLLSSPVSCDILVHSHSRINSSSLFSAVPYFNSIFCLFKSLASSLSGCLALLWLLLSHFLSTLLLEKQLEESPPSLSLPVPPSVSLNMVLMRCRTFILTIRWSQIRVSVAQSHVSLLVSVCDSRWGVWRGGDLLFCLWSGLEREHVKESTEYSPTHCLLILGFTLLDINQILRRTPLSS